MYNDLSEGFNKKALKVMEFSIMGGCVDCDQLKGKKQTVSEYTIYWTRNKILELVY